MVDLVDSKKLMLVGIAVLASFVLLSGCKSRPPEGVDGIPSGRWELYIKDVRGRPIAGATVISEWDGAPFKPDVSFDEFMTDQEVKSDTEGVVVLTRARGALVPAPLDWSRWTVRVSASGYEDARVTVREIQRKKEARFIVLRQKQTTTDPKSNP